ncbi:hypothetical protein ACOSQ4_019888 [Xanthoceras sorbifolium]
MPCLTRTGLFKQRRPASTDLSLSLPEPVLFFHRSLIKIHLGLVWTRTVFLSFQIGVRSEDCATFAYKSKY